METLERQTPPQATDDQLNSKLPADIIENILSRLCLKDAIRTSVLSRGWRDRWRSAVRRLEFDERGFQARDWQKHQQQEFWRDYIGFWNMVDGVLRQKTGTADRIALYLLQELHPPPALCLLQGPRPPSARVDVERWVRLAVGGHGATDVCISHCFSQRPSVRKAWLPCSVVFSCRTLVSISLDGCALNMPEGFEGFQHLCKISLCNCAVYPEGMLGELIINCPSLESVYLRDVVGCWRCSTAYLSDAVRCLNLEIVAPKLRSLHVIDCAFQIMLKDCPVLESLEIIYPEVKKLPDFFHKIWEENQVRCRIADVFSGPCDSIQQLAFGGGAGHFTDSPDKLRRDLERLKSLSLHLDLCSWDDLAYAFCLFKSSPALEHLSVNILYEVDAGQVISLFLQNPGLGFASHQLKRVHIKMVLPCRHQQVELCAFLLANCPYLEAFCVGSCSVEKDDFLNIIECLSTAKKASKNVMVTVEMNGEIWEAN